MTDEEPPPAIVEHDLPCFECGYNLRGLPVNANCPECATMVVSAFRGEGLEYANPDWLTWIGQSLRAMMYLLWLPLVFVHFLTVSVPSFYAACVIVAFYVGEGWRISRADGREVNDANARRRWPLRAVATALAIVPSLKLSGAQWVTWVAAGFVAVEGVYLWLYLSTVASIARRLPDFVLHARFQRLRWVLPSTWVAVYAVTFFPSSTARTFALILTVLLLYGSTFFCVLSLWWLRERVHTVLIAVYDWNHAIALPLVPPKDT